jgi:CheY-like chemotaxis protein
MYDSKMGKTRLMSENGRRILVIGKSSPVVEGVSELLRLTGYQVAVRPTWVGVERPVASPDLVIIVDLSSPFPETQHVLEEIHRTPHWGHVPILFVSFSNEDNIRELQQRLQSHNGGQLSFFVHTVLGIDSFLDKVQTCLS